MLSINLCHFPSGSSIEQFQVKTDALDRILMSIGSLFKTNSSQFQHYGQEITYLYFGRKLQSTNYVPKNFRVDQISVPLSLHVGKQDVIATPIDVNKLIPMLKNAKDLYHQEIEDFNHSDFIYAYSANKLVYSKVLAFFEKHKSS